MLEPGRRLIDMCLPSDFFGFRKNWGCTLATWNFRAGIDSARVDDRAMFFITFDVSAAFDACLREVNAAIYKELGFDPKWIAAQERMWAGMRGQLKLDGHEVGGEVGVSCLAVFSIS